MVTRRWSARLAGLAALFMCSAAWAAGPDDYRVDERGRCYRARFDPGHEIRVGLSVGASDGEGRDTPHVAATGGLALRTESRGGMKHDEVQWHLEHRLAWLRVYPASEGVNGIPAGELTAYQGSYARHTEEPFLMWPSNPPKRLFFPFDIGVGAESARIRIRAAHGEDPDEVRLRVLRGSVLLDPWRSGRPGNAIQFGVGARYDVDLDASEGWDSNRTTHRLAPFTEAMLRLRMQDDMGRLAFAWEGTITPHWDSRHGWRTDVVESALELERVLVAVNDVPVSFTVQAEYERIPRLSSDGVRTELRGLTGLKVGVPLR